MNAIAKMTDAQLKKLAIAKKITEQSVYLPESGLRKNVETALIRLSASDLANLLLLIEMRDLDHEQAK
jgi:hypothetical protein